MKNKDIYELLRIFSSEVQFKDLKSAINQLLNAEVLSGIEKGLCNSILEQIEMNSKIDLVVISKKLSIIDYSNENVDGYAQIDFFNKVDEFISNRKKYYMSSALKKISMDAENDNISKNATDLVFSRYSNIIDIPEDDNIYNELEELEEPKLELSTAIKIVDDTVGGLPNGLTTIVGDTVIAKSLWAINVAYSAITKNKNVLYFSLGTSAEDVYKRFLARHSCDKDKFEKEFSFVDLKTEYDVTNYKIIYNDFKNNYLSNLVVFDESEFLISTHYNLQKLIIEAQKRFIKRTGEGIDLIILDDFSFMKLDRGRQCITNQATIVNEYFNYLRDQSKNLLGTNKKIPVLVTISPNSNNRYWDLYQLYNAVTNSIKVLSDNVFVVFSDIYMKDIEHIKVGVLQSFNGEILEEEKEVIVQFKNWYIKYDSTSDVSIKEKLKDKEKENQKLKEETVEAKRDLESALLGEKNIVEKTEESVSEIKTEEVVPEDTESITLTY